MNPITGFSTLPWSFFRYFLPFPAFCSLDSRPARAASGAAK
jgi:hypothetical protein